MPTIFAIVKVIALIQLVVVLLLLLLSYGLKIYAYFKLAQSEKIQNSIEQLFIKSLKNKGECSLKSLQPYKRYTKIITDLIIQFDNSMDKERWPLVRQKIIDLVLLPEAIILTNSRIWQKRYIACRALALSRKEPNENMIKTLLKDPIPLVSINAALLAINCNSQTLIDAVIDTFEKGRHVQQSLYAQVISKANETAIPLIKNRLDRETDPYIKAFCYRTLAYLSTDSETVKTANSDLKSDNLELKLSVLSYLVHAAPASSGALLVSLLKDSQWEVRAKAAMLLGALGDNDLADSLEDSLKDLQWWVRVNAAEALVKLGPKGISILKRQDPNIDQFAYDVSTHVLCTKAPKMGSH